MRYCQNQSLSFSKVPSTISKHPLAKSLGFSSFLDIWLWKRSRSLDVGIKLMYLTPSTGSLIYLGMVPPILLRKLRCLYAQMNQVLESHFKIGIICPYFRNSNDVYTTLGQNLMGCSTLSQSLIVFLTLSSQNLIGRNCKLIWNFKNNETVTLNINMS